MDSAVALNAPLPGHAIPAPASSAPVFSHLGCELPDSWFSRSFSVVSWGSGCCVRRLWVPVKCQVSTGLALGRCSPRIQAAVGCAPTRVGCPGLSTVWGCVSHWPLWGCLRGRQGLGRGESGSPQHHPGVLGPWGQAAGARSVGRIPTRDSPPHLNCCPCPGWDRGL